MNVSDANVEPEIIFISSEKLCSQGCRLKTNFGLDPVKCEYQGETMARLAKNNLDLKKEKKKNWNDGCVFVTSSTNGCLSSLQDLLQAALIGFRQIN